MLAPATRSHETLPAGHPCEGCEVRNKAVCGVLGCQDLARFKNLGRTMRVPAGHALFHQGDPAERVFTLTRGSLKLYKLLADGRRHIAGFIYPGDFLGIIVEEQHAFTAEAVEDSQLCWFSRPRFDDFVDHHASMQRELCRSAAHELAAAQQQLVLLGRKTASERLATFLVHLSDRAKTIRGRDPALVKLPMSRSDIADYLGLTKETVSRVLSSFRRDRVIRLAAIDEVEIIDRRRLVECAEAVA